MNINEQKIKGDLQQFSVPAYDNNKMHETIHLAKKAYRDRMLSKRIGLWEFISVQVRFIGRWVWLTQAVLLLGFIVLLNGYHLGNYELQHILLLFSSVSPMIAFVGFPELLKSYAHNMEEIESCTRFSMRKLMGARMLVLGLADLCCLTVIMVISTVNEGTFALRMVLYLFVPFNLTCCGCLTVLSHVKSRYGGYYCGAICVLCIAAFGGLSFAKKYYETAATGIWIAMFILTTVYIVIEVARTFKRFNCFCSREETISVNW